MIQAGPHLITAAHPLPGDLRQALAAITSPCPPRTDTAIRSFS